MYIYIYYQIKKFEDEGDKNLGGTNLTDEPKFLQK